MDITKSIYSYKFIKSIYKRHEDIHWMINKYCQYKLCIETLCLAINIYDRFNDRNLNNDITYLAIASLFIACKYEEVDQLLLLDLLNDKTKVKDVIEMERIILKTLEFKLSIPTVMKYLQNYIGDDIILYNEASFMFIKYVFYNKNSLYLLEETIAKQIYDSISNKKRPI